MGDHGDLNLKLVAGNLNSFPKLHGVLAGHFSLIHNEFASITKLKVVFSVFPKKQEIYKCLLPV